MEAGADDDLGGVRMIPAFSSICFLLTPAMYFSFQDVTGSLRGSHLSDFGYEGTAPRVL